MRMFFFDFLVPWHFGPTIWTTAPREILNRTEMLSVIEQYQCLPTVLTRKNIYIQWNIQVIKRHTCTHTTNVTRDLGGKTSGPIATVSVFKQWTGSLYWNFKRWLMILIRCWDLTQSWQRARVPSFGPRLWPKYTGGWLPAVIQPGRVSLFIMSIPIIKPNF